MNAYHHTEINTPRDLLETLAAGPYAWPGGYPMYFITQDGCALSFDAVKKSALAKARDIKERSFDRVVWADVNYEDGNLYCDETGEPIPSAYGDD